MEVYTLSRDQNRAPVLKRWRGGCFAYLHKTLLYTPLFSKCRLVIGRVSKKRHSDIVEGGAWAAISCVKLRQHYNNMVSKDSRMIFLGQGEVQGGRSSGEEYVSESPKRVFLQIIICSADF